MLPSYTMVSALFLLLAAACTSRGVAPIPVEVPREDADLRPGYFPPAFTHHAE